MTHKCTGIYKKSNNPPLPFPLICYLPDFTAFGLRETLEYHVAQWS